MQEGMRIKSKDIHFCYFYFLFSSKFIIWHFYEQSI